MDEKTVRRILREYGVVPERFLAPQKGYRNESWPVLTGDGRWLNLILYKREADITRTIRAANEVSDFLAQRGFAARQTMDSRIICISGGQAKTSAFAGVSGKFPPKYGALYTYLPGQTIPWEGYTMNHLKLLGAAMSDMHAALRYQEFTDLPLVTEVYSGIIERMSRYFFDSQVAKALKDTLDLTLPTKVLINCTDLLEVCKKLPGRQPLHMDFVRGNILFSPAAATASNPPQPLTITGILDFEKTAIGLPVFDIARTLAFLLVDCKFKPEAKIRKYFLRSGYNKRGQAMFTGLVVTDSSRNIDVLEHLIDLFLLYDFYKFLRHNPYEFLPQNQHFARTRDLLLRRRMLQ